MIDDIIKSVGIGLSKEFEDVKLYDTVVKQGFDTPCFCISAYSVENSLFRGQRYRYKGSLELRYYADNKNESAAVMEKLYSCLEYIDVEGVGLIRGNDMKCTLCDDYFAFNVSYEFFYVKQEEKDYMGSVSFDIKL